MDIAQIAQLGVAGLAVFLMYRISSNHIDHNTVILGELRDAIKSLVSFLEKDK